MVQSLEQNQDLMGKKNEKDFTYQPGVGKFSVHVVGDALESCQPGVHLRQTSRDLAARKRTVHQAACRHGLQSRP